MVMTSRRPYVVRAIYEWIVDNHCTPYILVNANGSGVAVPQDYARNGQIVLNISETAVRGLLISNKSLEFSGRFGGVSMQIYVPMDSVLGIYTKENGQGIIFDPEVTEPSPDPSDPTPNKSSSQTSTSKPQKSGRPSLRVVK